MAQLQLALAAAAAADLVAVAQPVLSAGRVLSARADSAAEERALGQAWAVPHDSGSTCESGLQELEW